MDKYLNIGIKEIIAQFPQVADILNEYNIGCVPCNIGTCLLKDIVEIHNLPEDDETQLLARIAKVIYPDREIQIPKIERKTKSKEIKYCPPIKKLVDEHFLIKKWLALIPAVTENLDIKSEAGRKLILEGIDFIRSYADKFHHAKEEEILFKYFDENLDILKTMLLDHETARYHVRAIIEALEKQDTNEVINHLNGYKELLSEHIKKEDEILYPWMERNLSLAEIGELFNKFNEADEKIGEVVQERCREFVKRVEGKFNVLKEVE